MKRKFVVIAGLSALAILIIGGGYVFFSKYAGHIRYTPPRCLKDGEEAVFERLGDRLKEGPADVTIIDKATGKELFRFRIDNIVPHHRPYEFHRCGVYVIRQFNYNPITRRRTPNYRNELWRYDYSGRGAKVLLFSESDATGNYKSYFNDDFRIDPQEIYIALESGYPGQPERYGFTIRDIRSSNDVFFLTQSSILKVNPNLAGNLGLRGWSKSGDYFWGNIFIGAPVLGFVRIARDSWKYDILPAPDGVLGGDPLNVENGYVTVHPGNIWIGIEEFNEQEKARRRAQGIGTELYIHNLFTGERQFVASTTEPLWYFKPRWLSDTELEYTLPSGEKRIYKISDEK